MADISSINLNGNSYNIKDNNAVSKSGDTMTGELSMAGLGSTSAPIQMLNANGSTIGGLFQFYDTGRICLAQTTPNLSTTYSKGERYLLPTPTDHNATTYYVILTNKNPVTLAQGGTGATTATAALANLGAVAKAGDTMTGNLVISAGSNYKGIRIEGATGASSINFYNTGTRLTIDQYVNGSAGGERFLLPTPEARSSDEWYTILTSKSPVTIAQGGTGATTAANALANLGAVAKSGDTMTGSLQIKSSTIDSSSTNPPSSNQHFVGLGIYDKNNKYIGYLQAGRKTDGNNYFQFGARRIINSANKDTSLILYIDAEGNASCTLPKITSGTWNGSTIDVAHGGTGVTTLTSGAALIGNGTNDVTTRSITNNTSKNYITANTNLITANTLGYWNGAYNSGGSSNISYLGTISKGTWHGSAIGLDYGGTGGTDSEWQPYTDSKVFTGTIYYRKVGVFFEIQGQQINLKNTLTAGGSVLLMTVPSTYKPAKEIMPSCFINSSSVQNRVAPMRLAYNGQLYLYANKTDAIDSSYNLYFSGFGM